MAIRYLLLCKLVSIDFFFTFYGFLSWGILGSKSVWPGHPINIGPHCVTGFPCGSAGKESACNVGDMGAIPGLGRSPGEGKGYPLQYSGLENSMECIVHGVTVRHN